MWPVICYLLSLVPQHGQRRLSQDPVGTEKTHEHGEYDGGCTSRCQNRWLEAPGKIEHRLKDCLGKHTRQHGPQQPT